VLGVIIGTGTIIGVGAILTGFDTSITAVLRSFGPNSIIVFKFPVGPREGNLSPEERTRKDLTYQNAVDIKRTLQGGGGRVAHALPQTKTVNAHYKGNDMYDVNLMGVEEAYARGGQVDMHLGRFFTDEESRRRMPVAVIGADIEKGLVRQRGPDRQRRFLVDGHEFLVVGTMLRPAASFFGDTDNRVLLPYGMMQQDVSQRARRTPLW
jgi:putative ABC transport system permease protein